MKFMRQMKASIMIMVMLAMLMHDGLPHMHLHEHSTLHAHEGDHFHHSGHQHEDSKDHNSAELSVLDFLLTHHSHSGHSKTYLSNNVKISIVNKQFSPNIFGNLQADYIALGSSTNGTILRALRKLKIPDNLTKSSCSLRGPPVLS